MATPLDSPDDRIFEKLQQHVDPKILEDKARRAAEEERAQYERAQARAANLIQENSTLPTTVSSIRILNAPHTRRSFLQRIFNPILSANNDRPYTLNEALRELTIATDKLHKFDIFDRPITISIDRPPQLIHSSTPTDIDIYLQVSEKSRILLKTGTDVGNAEGNAYINVQGRNVFGGAESVNLNASLGTRTRSAYQASFETPIFSNPDFSWEFGGLASSTDKPWASHEEALKGGWTKLKWLASNGSRHDLTYNGVWRQLTGLSPNASPTIRHDAGDSVKSSITHSWSLDRRNNPFLPSRGYLTKSTLELAGWGPLQGDVAFGKAEVEGQGAVSIPLPFLKGDSGISLTTGLRAGLLYPLPATGSSKAGASRTNDRFQLGGPTDVRGFRLSGLGPHDGADAVGGDVYAAGSANLLLPLPRVGADKPFRLQAFVTGGRLLALPAVSAASISRTSTKKSDDDTSRGSDAAAAGTGTGTDTTHGSGSGGMSTFQDTVAAAAKELGNGLPSLAAGVGLVYAHPVARFELNFSLPLVQRKGEEARKGLQFGVGINML